MSHSVIDKLLSNFANQIQGVQGLTLISDTGYILTKGWGMDDSQPLITAGRMLQTAMLLQDDFQWETFNHLSIRAKEGYFELIPCVESVFLLVYSTVQWSGFLEQEITHLVNQLRTQLKQGLAVLIDDYVEENIPNEQPESLTPPVVSVSPQVPPSPIVSPQVPPSPVVAPVVSPSLFKKYQQELAHYIGPVASIVCSRINKEYHSLTPSELVSKMAQFIPSPQEATKFIESCASFGI